MTVILSARKISLVAASSCGSIRAGAVSTAGSTVRDAASGFADFPTLSRMMRVPPGAATASSPLPLRSSFRPSSVPNAPLRPRAVFPETMSSENRIGVPDCSLNRRSAFPRSCGRMENRPNCPSTCGSASAAHGVKTGTNESAAALSSARLNDLVIFMIPSGVDPEPDRSFQGRAAQ